jgi:hypothetical protein
LCHHHFAQILANPLIVGIGELFPAQEIDKGAIDKMMWFGYSHGQCQYSWKKVN